MTMIQPEPAQRKLIHGLIDWERVESRLDRYPTIKRAFPLAEMRKHCESPPYYCHYMSWRLGTWENSKPFQRMEQLLGCGERLPNWHSERSLLRTAQFGDFWSLVWQLQVAEHLCGIGTGIRWSKSGGPDLSVIVDGKRWYVECYIYHKSFDLLHFLRDLLPKIDPGLSVYYDLCLPFQLARDSSRTSFLDEIISTFLTEEKIEKARAKSEYPQVLYCCADSSFCIYLKGDSADMPGKIPNNTGDTTTYLETVFREAVNKKKKENRLKKHRPNILAVNYSLSEDFQVAEILRRTSLTSPNLPQISPNVDALATCTIGIEDQLTSSKLKVKVTSSGIDDTTLAKIANLPIEAALTPPRQ